MERLFKRKKVRGKVLSVILSMSLIICSLAVGSVKDSQAATATQESYGSDDAIITNKGLTYDVFINEDSGLPYDVSLLASKVSSELDDMIKNGDVDRREDTYRVKTGVNSIDTTDISGWYVYDHYDTN